MTSHDEPKSKPKVNLQEAIKQKLASKKQQQSNGRHASFQKGKNSKVRDHQTTKSQTLFRRKST